MGSYKAIIDSLIFKDSQVDVLLDEANVEVNFDSPADKRFEKELIFVSDKGVAVQ